MNFMTSRCLRFLKLWKSHFCLLVALADILFMLHVKMKTLLLKWIIIWILSSWDPANMNSCAGLFDFIYTAQDLWVWCVLELPRIKCIFAADGTNSSRDSSWTPDWNCNSCFASINACGLYDWRWQVRKVKFLMLTRCAGRSEAICIESRRPVDSLYLAVSPLRRKIT